MSAESLAPLMFAALVLFLLVGHPVAFPLAANGLLFAVIGIEYGLLTPDLLGALPHRIYGIMQNETLLAIPFFTFMGLVMERSGLAEDLLDTIGQLFGPLRGGIAYAVIFVGALRPGRMLAGLYMVYVLVITLIKPAAAPALPLSARSLTGRQLAIKVLV